MMNRNDSNIVAKQPFPLRSPRRQRFFTAGEREERRENSCESNQSLSGTFKIERTAVNRFLTSAFLRALCGRNFSKGKTLRIGAFRYAAAALVGWRIHLRMPAV